MLSWFERRHSHHVFSLNLHCRSLAWSHSWTQPFMCTMSKLVVCGVTVCAHKWMAFQGFGKLGLWSKTSESLVLTQPKSCKCRMHGKPANLWTFLRRSRILVLAVQTSTPWCFRFPVCSNQSHLAAMQLAAVSGNKWNQETLCKFEAEQPEDISGKTRKHFLPLKIWSRFTKINGWSYKFVFYKLFIFLYSNLWGPAPRKTSFWQHLL